MNCGHVSVMGVLVFQVTMKQFIQYLLQEMQNSIVVGSNEPYCIEGICNFQGTFLPSSHLYSMTKNKVSLQTN